VDVDVFREGVVRSQVKRWHGPTRVVWYSMMSAAAITPRVLRWLRAGRPARILHLLADVCNLVNDQDEVISLVSPRIGPGPFMIVLDEELHLEIDANQTVRIDDARQLLALGSWMVDLRQAAIWQPIPDWSRLQDTDVDTGSLPVQLAPELDTSLKQTIAGIATNDPPTCLAGVKGLAGRGGGLTPAGDDVLMGLLYGLWAWYPRREWMEMIVETAVPRTTTLSANFLRAAAGGEAVWQWHDLVNNRPRAVEKIVSIGHSSGADALAGFVYAAQCL
jgi:hypothetical protein